MTLEGKIQKNFLFAQVKSKASLLKMVFCSAGSERGFWILQLTSGHTEAQGLNEQNTARICHSTS